MKLNELILDNINVCYPKALLPKQNDSNKSNVFVGIGLWSKSHGLTAGLPIDVLSLLITADKLRNQLDYDNGIIYVFVADIFALESRSDQSEITETDILAQRDRTIEAIYEICQWLKIRNIIIEDSRTLYANYSVYQQIVEKVELNHSSHPIGKIALDESTKNYVLKQTALIGYYFREKNCALKISWCFDSKYISKKPEEIIACGLKNLKFDELWFDAYYQLYLGEIFPIGFVYTQPGIALETSSKNGNQKLAAPYFAKNQFYFPRVLFGDSINTLLGNDETEGKVARSLYKGPSVKKGTVIKEENNNKFKYTIQSTFKKNILAILRDLKTGYADCIKIESGKDEYRVLTIINDLVNIANFTQYQLNNTNNTELSSDQNETLNDNDQLTSVHQNDTSRSSVNTYLSVESCNDTKAPFSTSYSPESSHFNKPLFTFFRSERETSCSGIGAPDLIPVTSISETSDLVSITNPLVNSKLKQFEKYDAFLRPEEKGPKDVGSDQNICSNIIDITPNI